MIVLDTNVVSELMRDRPQQAVRAWFRAQSASSLFVTTVTEAEILTGIALLPDRRRRRSLSEAAARVFAVLLAGRILVFDSDASNIYAEIFAQRHATGRPISQADCQIAAIARSREAAIATRNITDFEEVGVELIDPWAHL
ncbi:type II toxin-antitoxin system VapC family toxin [Candidatus Poribacteria bacterium]|nr:type II toxin-antitoxin system VapC family toxin [Candidatus Poribacteria bacterium]